MIKLETQGFCINLIVSTRSLTIITLEANEGVLPPQIVVMDYDNLPLRCTCYSCARKVKNNFKKKPYRGEKRPPYVFHPPQKRKGKGIDIDQDGYQQTRSRKTTRIVFDTNEDTYER